MGLLLSIGLMTQPVLQFVKMLQLLLISLITFFNQQRILLDYIFSCRTEESGIEWYKSKDRVLKQSETDLYGEQGKEIHIYARCCLTSDVEHKQSK